MSSQQPFEPHNPGSYQPPAGPAHYSSVPLQPPYSSSIPSQDSTIVNDFTAREIKSLHASIRKLKHFRWIAIVLLFIFLSSNILFIYRSILSSQEEVSQANTIISLRRQLTATPLQKNQSSVDQFDQDTSGWQMELESLASDDALDGTQWKNSDKEPMQLGQCLFIQGTYHAKAFPGSIGNTCTATLKSSLSDLAVQVDMQLVEGNEEGLAFRWVESDQNNISDYQFRLKRVGLDGLWYLSKTSPTASNKLINDIPILGLFKDRSRSITLGIRAVGDNIDLYINGSRVGHQSDPTSLGAGTIGLSAGPGVDRDGSDVMFSNLEIGIPPTSLKNRE